VLGTVISTTGGSRPRAVVDVGLKALGMDHGPPTLHRDRGISGDVWFVSDEHLSIGTTEPARVGDRAWVVPAHIDPTMAMHEHAWLVDGDDVVERWPIDLRGW
jgi:D-serine deaminase-like pyridoxal phosphate-dependent protein